MFEKLLEHKTKANPSKSSKNVLVNYEIYFPIGRGAHSFVYKALHRPTNQVVALKVIQYTNEKERETIIREIEIHSSLKHPNITKLLDSFHDDKNYYLVLEHCEKGEFYSYYIRNKRKITETEIRSVMTQLLSALNYIHSKGIIHRDVKLGNILLSDKMDVKLTDFGLSIEYDKRSLIKKETIIGTPNYMSPEIILHQKVTFSNDLWSLGCAIYALFFGEFPFEGSTYKETLKNIINKPYDIKKACSDDFKELLAHLLNKEYDKRRKTSQVMKLPFFEEKSKIELTSTTVATENTNNNSIGNVLKKQSKANFDCFPNQTAKVYDKNGKMFDRIFGNTNTFQRNTSLKKTDCDHPLNPEFKNGVSLSNFKQKSSSTVKSRLNIQSVLNSLSQRFDFPGPKVKNPNKEFNY